jgi:betaine-aldehyde dehydrogenase
MQVFGHFIAGKPVPARSTAYMPVTDPCTSDVLVHVGRADDTIIQQAVSAAARAMHTWGRSTPAQREKVLLNVADRIEQHQHQLTSLEVSNTGKPYQPTLAEEILVAADVFRFYAGAIRHTMTPAAGCYHPDHLSYLLREPVGVCVQLIPSNYPMLMATWKIAAAVAAGNTVVVKPSSSTPISVLELAQMTADILPPGVLNVICGDRSCVQTLVTHPQVAHVSATASTASGISIGQMALKTMKRLHLGLGGKAPAIVCPGADLRQAAEKIAHAAFFNAGQDCTAASRIVVTPQIADEFTGLLLGLLPTTGAPSEGEFFFGPLTTRQRCELIAETLSQLPQHMNVFHGPPAVGPSEGFFHPATVITGVTEHDPIVTTELFGPVLTIEVADDLAEAVARANRCDYGLAASIHSRHEDDVMYAIRNLNYGCVWVNTHLPLVSEMPHGGFGTSGIGKDLSAYGLDEYVRVKHVMHRTPH